MMMLLSIGLFAVDGLILVWFLLEMFLSMKWSRVVTLAGLWLVGGAITLSAIYFGLKYVVSFISTHYVRTLANFWQANGLTMVMVITSVGLFYLSMMLLTHRRQLNALAKIDVKGV